MGQDDRADHAGLRGQRGGERIGQAVDLSGTSGDPFGDLLPLAGPPTGRRHGGRRAGERTGCRDPGRQFVDPAAQTAGRDPLRHVGHDRDGDRFASVGRAIVLDGILEIADRQEGRRIVDTRTGADEGRLEDPCVGTPAGDDDMVGAGRLGELIDDGPEDRIGRDRARQARQDPGERFGLFATTQFEGGDGLAVTDRGEADDEDEGDDRPVDGSRKLGTEPDQGDGSEDEERDGEDPPRSSDPTIRRVGGSYWRAGGFAHVRDRGWRSGGVASIPDPRTDG